MYYRPGIYFDEKTSSYDRRTFDRWEVATHRGDDASTGTESAIAPILRILATVAILLVVGAAANGVAVWQQNDTASVAVAHK